jgi:hypothetical protein
MAVRQQANAARTRNRDDDGRCSDMDEPQGGMESAEHGLDRDKNLPLRRVGYKVAGFRVIASLLGGPGLPVPSRRTLA